MTTIHVVSHTHWDREWYQPFERFRQRLVALVDELLDDPPDAPGSFLLDGQAVLIRDYLEVRPERREELAALIRAGRLEAGPWYVLADELIPSGEALVRNLFEGRRTMAALGGASPPVLYCPDSFGHPAALPSIAAGFGLGLVILWRGFGGRRWPAGDLFHWGGDEGKGVTMYHLPRAGYEFGASLPVDRDRVTARWAAIRKELIDRSAAGVVLLLNGADHHARQEGLDRALELLREAASTDGDDVRGSSLSAFATDLAAATEGEGLPVVRGELRDSYGYTWTLQGTFATRAHQKRANAQAERTLIREAEMFAAMAWFGGAGSPAPSMRAAWRTLLEAHPHDTLCGCSIDEVAAAASVRIDAARSQAAGIRDDSISALLGQDPDAARTKPMSEWIPVVVLRNSAPRARGGVAIADVLRFLDHEPVGPGSGNATNTRPRDQLLSLPASDLLPHGVSGLEGARTTQLLDRRIGRDRLEFSRAYPDNDLVAVERVALWVEPVPAFGVTCLPIVEPERVSRRATLPNRVRARGLSVANGLIALTLAESRRLHFEDLESGRRIDGLIAIESATDRGDLYTPSIRERSTFDSLSGRTAARGPLVGTLDVRWRTSTLRQTGISRDLRATVASITASATVHADSRIARIRIHGVSSAIDHRLRIRIATGIRGAEVWADAAFGAVRRAPIQVVDAELEMETPPRTAPLHRYVSLFSGDAGATVFSDGLAEYEADEDGNVYVTLVRSVGSLSRNDIPERPGHAGWPADTPAAQCIGPFEAELAILLHGPRTVATIDAIERAADDFLLPLQGGTLRNAIAPPPNVPGVELEGVGLAFSAAKQSESEAHLVLRCVNLTDAPQAGAWHLPGPVAEAWRARLDETAADKPIPVDGSTIDFVAGPREIVTILVGGSLRPAG